eukprot:6213453-Pleurochrysis_carterae.AAC.7
MRKESRQSKNLAKGTHVPNYLLTARSQCTQRNDARALASPTAERTPKMFYPPIIPHSQISGMARRWDQTERAGGRAAWTGGQAPRAVVEGV